MTSKNGNDPIGDSVDKVLSLYAKLKTAAADSIKREPVAIWGETVYVQTLTADDRDEYEGWLARLRAQAQERGEEPSIRGIRAKCAVLSVVDEHGTHLFSDADREWLGQGDAATLDAIWTVADRLSALTTNAKADLGKDSPATPGAAGPSPSPTNSAKPGANSSVTSTPTS